MSTAIVVLAVLGALGAFVLAIVAGLIAGVQKLRGQESRQAAWFAAWSAVACVVLLGVGIIATPSGEVASNDPKPVVTKEEKAEPKKAEPSEAKAEKKQPEKKEATPKVESSEEVARVA